MDNKSLRADKEATKQGERLAASEEKIKSLEARLGTAEASVEALTPATESTKQACYMLRLALNDLGARAEGAPTRLRSGRHEVRAQSTSRAWLRPRQGFSSNNEERLA